MEQVVKRYENRKKLDHGNLHTSCVKDDARGWCELQKAHAMFHVENEWRASKVGDGISGSWLEDATSSRGQDAGYFQEPLVNLVSWVLLADIMDYQR